MAEPCPTAGYTCVNTMVARVQSLADQIGGFLALLDADVFPVKLEHMRKHYSKVAELLQVTLDEYTHSHGRPTPQEDVQAMVWVLHSLGH